MASFIIEAEPDTDAATNFIIVTTLLLTIAVTTARLEEWAMAKTGFPGRLFGIYSINLGEIF